MLYAFVASKSKNKIEIIYKKTQEIFQTKFLLEESNGWYFILKYQKEVDIHINVFSNQDDKHYLIGEIYNLQEIKIILAQYDSAVLISNTTETIVSLIKYLGASGLSLLEGNFCMISILRDSSLRIITDQLGQTRVYSVYGEDYYITSELKTLSLAESNIFDFYDIKDFYRVNKICGDQFIPIKNCTSFQLGSVSTIKQLEEAYYTDSKKYNAISLGYDKVFSQKEAFDLIESTLINSIENCLDGAKNPVVTISGGLDSGIVSSIVSRSDSTVSTISIGTNESNEFKESGIVSQFIKSKHKEIIISDEEVLFSIIKAIFYNEIFDGLSAEIQSGLFSVYQNVPENTDVLLTGYGADLIFGGILDSTINAKDVNRTLWQQILRTRWTGEFSLLGGGYHDLRVRNPFWSSRVISCFKDLDSSNKISNGEVKCLLKKYAEEKNLLPKETIFRKKIGIHEGSSINYIFGRLLSTAKHDYDSKNLFTYNLYKSILNSEVSIKDLNSFDVLRKYGGSN